MLVRNKCYPRDNLINLADYIEQKIEQKIEIEHLMNNHFV
jgi:hypothetical protein